MNLKLFSMAVKDQAEKMVKEGRIEYDSCLNKAKNNLPATPSFLKDDACKAPAEDNFDSEKEENKLN